MLELRSLNFQPSPDDAALTWWLTVLGGCE